MDPAPFSWSAVNNYLLSLLQNSFVRGSIDKDKDTKKLIKLLKRHKNELFTFLDFDDVSPYNNHAEQQLLKPVITRKISQQNRSKQGAKTQAILMSLFISTELQGLNPVYTILAYSKYAIDPVTAER